jgi:NAD+ synthase
MTAMATPERIAGWMRQQMNAAGAGGLLVGLSGGVDSAVVARLAQLAAPGAATTVILPCHSEPHDEDDAALVARHFAIPTLRIDLSAAYDEVVRALQPIMANPDNLRNRPPLDPVRGRVPLANIKPRLRMTTLYYLANTLNYLVAGTGNRSEIAVGYFTKWGDGGVDLLPLGRLTKKGVRAMAEELDVPRAIIDRTPSAGLWAGQKDEEEMGVTYAELDRYLADGPPGVAPAVAMKIERLVRASDHKREMPPIPDFD